MSAIEDRFQAERFQSSFVTDDGASIAFRAWVPAGSSSAILLLHRGHEHSGRMERVAETLAARGHAVFAWDARGHGRSQGPVAETVARTVCDLDQFADVIRDDFGFSRDRISVIANSIASITAITWVLDHAPRIRALVLVCPAFSVRLYVPFALAMLRLMRRVMPRFHVRSYVRGRLLTHDPAEAVSYDRDPLIRHDVPVGLLVDLHDAARRALQRAPSIHVPTLVLSAGSDWVVRNAPQRTFASRVAGAHAIQEFDSAFHALLHETCAPAAIDEAASFIEGSPRPAGLPRSEAIDADYARRRAALPWLSLSNAWYGISRFALTTIGRVSRGILLGLRHGFDSGASLDHIVWNRPEGLTFLGRWLDRWWLAQAGWRAVRARHANLKRVVDDIAHDLRTKGRAIRILDVACGHGEYVARILREHPDATAILRDLDRDCVSAAKRNVRGLAAQCEHDDLYAPRTSSAGATIVIASGVFELEPDAMHVTEGLRHIRMNMSSGGWLIVTNQTWHPQLGAISRVLNDRSGSRWVMRPRPQAELAAILEAAGFTLVRSLADEHGIFTVNVASPA